MGERRIIHFSGTVQGVGFRFAACRAAGRFDVTGYVRNLSDGRVQCVVEGRPGQIDAFLAELGERMAGYVRETTQQTAPASGQYHSFGVKY